MVQVASHYERLSTRAGFNATVRHIKAAIALIEELSPANSFSDVARSREAAGVLEEDRISSLLQMVLVDKYGYVTAARNLEAAPEDLEAIAKDFAAWKAVDLVFAYHHPDVGLVVANPKNPDQLAGIGPLRRHELIVVYAGRLEKAADDNCRLAASLALDLLEGRKPKIPEALLTGPFKYKLPKSPAAAAPKRKATTAKPAAKAAPVKSTKAAAKVAPAAVAAAPAVQTAGTAVGAKARMTPMYSVVVSNELFHNGNVEAWKRIIASYKAKYPSLEVYVYYDGERILNINSLFKWGKVKHGSSIQFAVAGSEIKDVAKLQRYLYQGASPMFEAFLHGPISTVLKLF